MNNKTSCYDFRGSVLTETLLQACLLKKLPNIGKLPSPDEQKQSTEIFFAKLGAFR